MFESPLPFAGHDGVGAGRVPDEYAALARRLRTAEDRLFPLAMVDTDRYQRAVRLVGLLARRLVEACASLDELGDAEAWMRGWLVDRAHVDGVPVDGLDMDLVVEAAMSQRFRGLLGEQAAELQRQKIEQARDAGLTWVVLEEPDPAAWGAGSARWVEVHVATRVQLVRSVVADRETGKPTYRLEVVGAAGSGLEGQEFFDRDAWLAAARAVRNTFESES
jgi:hypothetical protein